MTSSTQTISPLRQRMILKKSVEHNPAENIQHKLDKPIGDMSTI